MCMYLFRLFLKDGEDFKTVYSNQKENQHLFHGSSIIPMQYTGVNDSMNSKVFEGDIFEIENEKFVVKWNYDLARFTLSNEEKEISQDFREYCEDREILGNSIVNRELIFSE